MGEESIQDLNEWFDDDERCFSTGYNEYGEYTVSSYDIEDFCNYLREYEPDLIGIKCMVGHDGIWFRREDLEQADYL